MQIFVNEKFQILRNQQKSTENQTKPKQLKGPNFTIASWSTLAEKVKLKVALKIYLQPVSQPAAATAAGEEEPTQTHIERKNEPHWLIRSNANEAKATRRRRNCSDIVLKFRSYLLFAVYLLFVYLVDAKWKFFLLIF